MYNFFNVQFIQPIISCYSASSLERISLFNCVGQLSYILITPSCLTLKAVEKLLYFFRAKLYIELSINKLLVLVSNRYYRIMNKMTEMRTYNLIIIQLYRWTEIKHMSYEICFDLVTYSMCSFPQ